MLDDALVNQIAAGEVVERPASVVKELLENSLDAGAKNIEVEVEEAGVVLIRVTDDGIGMSAEDARLALQRHATSKISSADDLVSIATLGFRGEALPSIASVSRFRLTTRTRDSLTGTSVRVDGGKDLVVEPIGHAPGTTVEARELFYNVPARRKFLRSTGTENAAVSEVCHRTAVGRHDLRLVLLRNGKRVREYLPEPTRAARIAHLYADPLREISETQDGVSIHAFLSAPERAGSGAAGLHVFVNGRPVRDRKLASAIAQAYGSVLPSGRYPLGVVFLELAPGMVDVNVHPQKSEVRLAAGHRALEAISRAVARGLGTKAFGAPVTARTASYWNERLGAPGPTHDAWGVGDALRDAPLPPSEPMALPLDEPAQITIATGGEFSRLRAVAQVRKMLVLCEGEDGLYVVDQHAADERVRFDKLKRAYLDRKVATQRLLIPERATLTPSDAARVTDEEETLLSLGFECVMLGETEVAIHAIPALVRRASPAKLLGDVIDELARRGGRPFGDAIDMALATMACHGSIRAGDVLSLDECAALLTAMDAVTHFAGHCPHGRPVLCSIPWRDLEQRVGR